MAKKAKQPPKRKRPKSVMEKAWATRRAKAAAMITPDTKERLLNNTATSTERKALKTASAGNVKRTRRSKPVPGQPKYELYPEFKKALLAGNLTGPGTINIPTDPLELKVDELLAVSRSNNRAEARPEFRHRLFELVHGAEFKAIEDATKAAEAKQDEALLCSFVAQFALIDRPSYTSQFAPHVVSPITLRAMLRLLESLGYTAKGKVTAATQRTIA